MDDLLVQTATKIATTTDGFGDVVHGAETTSPCLFRNVSTLSPSAANRYGVNISGLLWFGAGESVSRGDLYKVDGEYYKVEEVLVAQARVTDNATGFIKCMVSRSRQVS